MSIKQALDYGDGDIHRATAEPKPTIKIEDGSLQLVDQEQLVQVPFVWRQQRLVHGLEVTIEEESPEPLRPDPLRSVTAQGACLQRCPRKRVQERGDIS